MRWKHGVIQFLAGNIDRALHLGPVSDDKSSTGKMRDAYPLALFRLEHVIEFFEHGCTAEGIDILP
jgi:hypothetical protein